jgi:hypothetical protein
MFAVRSNRVVERTASESISGGFSSLPGKDVAVGPGRHLTGKAWPYCAGAHENGEEDPTSATKGSVQMTAATVSRWARRYVLASALFLVIWQAGSLAGIPRRAQVVLGIYGFVLHVVFGKAYSLVPAYFDCELAVSHAPAVQFPFVVAGAAGLAGSSLRLGPTWLGPAGGVLWSLGVAVFLGTLLWSIRDNPTGSDTATGETNAERRPVDRLANGFVPIAFVYLVLGTYETLAIHTGAPPLFGGYAPRASHLLAAGTAGLLILALGFRLLPRFMLASVPRALPAVVLPAGALGPLLLASHLGNPPWFQLGALVEATAVAGFALAVGLLFVRSERRRVGFYSVLAGVSSGVVAVAVGLWFAFHRWSPSLVLAHLRLTLLGFLGFTVVGLAYQFYPPGVGAFPAASDRTALLSIVVLAGGLLLQVIGIGSGVSLLATLGSVATFGGALLYTYLLVAVFAAR